MRASTLMGARLLERARDDVAGTVVPPVRYPRRRDSLQLSVWSPCSSSCLPHTVHFQSAAATWRFVVLLATQHL
jgi:hypothetical protein